MAGETPQGFPHDPWHRIINVHWPEGEPPENEWFDVDMPGYGSFGSLNPPPGDPGYLDQKHFITLSAGVTYYPEDWTTVLWAFPGTPPPFADKGKKGHISGATSHSGSVIVHTTDLFHTFDTLEAAGVGSSIKMDAHAGNSDATLTVGFGHITFRVEADLPGPDPEGPTVPGYALYRVAGVELVSVYYYVFGPEAGIGGGFCTFHVRLSMVALVKYGDDEPPEPEDS